MRQSELDLEQVRQYLHGVRLSGQERLPPERELAVALGLTRNRLRGGLRKLADEGLIWRKVGKGTYIGKASRNGAKAPAEANIETLTSPREVMEARIAFEPELARMAALRATGSDLDDMANCLAKIGESTDEAGASFWDVKFHRAIGVAAHNALMMIMLDTVQASQSRAIWGDLRNRLKVEPSHDGSVLDHAEIMRAIRNRDADAAARAMRAHLITVRRVLFQAEAD